MSDIKYVSTYLITNLSEYRIYSSKGMLEAVLKGRSFKDLDLAVICSV